MFGCKGGSGRGLAPTCGHVVLHMTQHIYYGPTVGACALHCIVLHCIAIYCIVYIYNRVLNVGTGFETKTCVLSVGAGPKWKLHGFQTV
jgi:hypothetical protein